MAIDHFFFGIYPYVVLSVFITGSWIRYDREPYTWKTDSSQLLAKKNLLLGSNLFHVGVIALFFGHAGGLLTPHAWLIALGISDVTHQWIAISAGTLFGLTALAGGSLLLHRRLTQPRVRAAGRRRDIVILVWLLATLLLGLSTIPFSISHAVQADTQAMIFLASWVQSVLSFQADPQLLANVGPVFKLHLVFGMTVFLLFPFTRLVHLLTLPVGYLGRAYQVVRTSTIPR